MDIRYFSEDQDLPLTLGLLVDTSGSQKTFLEDEIHASDLFFQAMLRRPADRALLVQFDTAVLLRQPMTSAAETARKLSPLSRHAPHRVHGRHSQRHAASTTPSPKPATAGWAASPADAPWSC